MTEQFYTRPAYIRPLDTPWSPPTVLCVGGPDSGARTVGETLDGERHGFTGTAAADADEAMDRLAESDVDCVVAQHKLSETTGVSLLERVRETDAALPFVLVVAEGSEAVAVEALNAGADGYVRTAEADDLTASVADQIGPAADRHRSRRQYEKATRLLTQLTEYTSDALWMFSPDWSELLFINSAYEDIWGDSLEHIVAEPQAFLEGVHPDDRQTVVEAMETLSNGESEELEFRVNPDEDYERWVSVRAEPTRDESGEIDHIAGFSRDVTRRKQREEALEEYKDELERSNANLKEFAYIASHDLQEPLRMVSSYLDLLEQEYGDRLDGEAQEYMDYVSDGARRMKQMIDSLLEYSRVHSRGEELDSVDAAAVFEDTRRDLELLIDEHDARVVVGDLPTVEADRDQLGQLFQNLVKNAIEHADDGSPPRVEVTATDAGEAVEFVVSDDGPGVPAGQEEDIFEIFNQGGASTGGSNTGIGLAVAQRIVQRHGGDIWVESEEGEGATFRFTIPRAGTEL